MAEQQYRDETQLQSSSDTCEDGEPFDYGDFDTDLANEAREIAERYRRRSKAYIIDTGCDLMLIKSRIHHGLFLRWVKAELGLEARTAQNFMQAAQHFKDKSEIVSRLPSNVIYKLAAPSTPESVRASVLERMAAGQFLEPKAVINEVIEARKALRILSNKKVDPRRLDVSTEHAPVKGSFLESPPKFDRKHARAKSSAEANIIKEAELGANYLLKRLGAEALAAFLTRFGKLPMQVLAKAADLEDVKRALGEPTDEVPVDAFEQTPQLESLNGNEDASLQATLNEAILNNGFALPPIVATKTISGLYAITEGAYTFLTLRDRLNYLTVPVRLVKVTGGASRRQTIQN